MNVNEGRQWARGKVQSASGTVGEIMIIIVRFDMAREAVVIMQ